MNIFVSRKEYQQYRECAWGTAVKYYKRELSRLNKEPDQELTVYDLSRIDQVPIDIVKQRCGKV